MRNSDCFNNALHDMVFENACGAAIRRLADMSFPVSYIHKELDYPISFERVQKYVWRYYLDNRVLLFPDDKLEYHEENGIIILNEPKVTKTFIKETGPYGKTTYRQVTVDSSKNDNPVNDSDSDSRKPGQRRYLPCNFGILKHTVPKEFEKVLEKLDRDNKNYLIDLPWENKVVYHILNERMTCIANALEKQ